MLGDADRARSRELPRPETPWRVVFGCAHTGFHYFSKGIKCIRYAFRLGSPCRASPDTGMWRNERRLSRNASGQLCLTSTHACHRMIDRLFLDLSKCSPSPDADLPCPGRLDSDIMAGVVNIVSSVIGLWAILYSNVRAVKLFLRSQALVLLMGQVNAVIHALASPKAKTNDEWVSFAFVLLFGIFCGLYQLKVRMVSPHSVCFVFPRYSYAAFPLCQKQSFFVSSRDRPNF